MVLEENKDFSFHSQLVGTATATSATSINTVTADGKAKQALAIVTASASGSTVKLQHSDDGTTFTDLDTFVSDATNDSGILKGTNLKRFVRLNATILAATSHVDGQLLLFGYDNIT
jgi:hypothetical protein